MLPTSGPVFNLTAGFTAFSLDGCIVDNRYLCAPSAASVPEPTMLGFVGLGLAGLGVVRRTRPA